ncbi:hypothetical protein GCM10023350_25780 [Nocardioides endophyticus]|uniref:Polysaccharide pyruvyl transferase domain-containing protein n=1 Tax=Nocardioides endophyticus TaxID=1353775 RepID=A0ABP8YX43_9ACTN
MGQDRVVLVNAWHDLNAGDSAIADVSVSLAKQRWPNSAIVVHTMLGDSDPDYPGWNRHLQRSHPDVEFLPALYPEPQNAGSTLVRRANLARRSLESLPLLWGRGRGRADRHLAGCLALVVIGGSDLFAVRSPRVLPDLRLARLLQPALQAAALGVPVHIWGHTLGPFETPRSRLLMAKALDVATEVVVRESRSRDLATELLPASDPVELPDLAFALTGTVAAGSTTARVIFVPRAQIHAGAEAANQRLVRTFAEFGRELVQSGRCAEVLVTPQVGGPGEREQDSRICEDIVHAASDSRVVMGPEGLGPRDLRNLYAGSNAVVAVRLHGAILAMSAGVPSFAVSYFTAKTAGVMESVGAPTSWCEWDDFTVARALDWYDNDRPRTTGPLQGRVDSHRHRILDELGRPR